MRFEVILIHAIEATWADEDAEIATFHDLLDWHPYFLGFQHAQHFNHDHEPDHCPGSK